MMGFTNPEDTFSTALIIGFSFLSWFETIYKFLQKRKKPKKSLIYKLDWLFAFTKSKTRLRRTLIKCKIWEKYLDAVTLFSLNDK